MNYEYIMQYADGRGIVMLDFYGNPIEKTKQAYPYSYRPYVQYQAEPKILAWAKLSGKTWLFNTNTLYKTDYNKYNKLALEIFGNDGQYWEEREHTDIETFLKKWTGNEALTLIKVTEFSNPGNGYPYWHFEFMNTELV